MGCADTTPWTITNHPYTLNRIRTTGAYTDQTTGEWVSDASGNTLAICGSVGNAGTSKVALSVESITALADGQFKSGDQYLVTHTDCDVVLNDLIEVYDDAAGTTKSYWRVITLLKTLTTFHTMSGYGMNYFLLRRDER